MLDIGLPIAFTSGVVSFFAPCVVPLVPAYIAYVTGVSLADLRNHGEERFRTTMFWSSLLYILGFSIIFVLLGVGAASFGILLRQHTEIIQRVGGILVIIFGLEFAGILNLGLLARERRFGLPGWANQLGHGRAFFLGLLFGLSWTPCVGAVLGTILILAANAGTVWQGGLLLFVYSLGISVPFLIISMTLVQAPGYLKVITKHIRGISLIAGLLLVGIGLLLVTDTYRYLNSWLFELAFSLGYQIR